MNNFKKFTFKFIIIIIGVLATVMILFPALVVENTDTAYTGVQIAFGHEFANVGNLASGQIQFSILNVIAYLLPLLGSLIFLLMYKKSLFAAIIFGAAAILLFFVPNFTVVTVTVLDTVNEISVNWTYGLGLTVACLLSVLASTLSFFEYFTH